MGVKNILARKYAGFVSLDQVLSQMAKSSGASYQECAEALYILFQEYPESAPNWYDKNFSQGVSKADASQQPRVLETLRHIAEFGYPNDGLPWSSDDALPF